MFRSFIFFVMSSGLALSVQAASSGRHYELHDLSHLVPLFAPLNGSVEQSDLSAPVAESQPIAGSGKYQAVRKSKPAMELPHGTVRWGFVFVDEHYSTHVDSTDHFVTKNKTLQTVDKADQRGVHAFSIDELVGPIVYIDISERVKRELEKNDGKPSSNLAVTNFNNDSGNNVTVADINAIEKYLVDGAYLVINVGWEPLYVGLSQSSNWAHPYINMMNHPGLTPEAVNRLIAIEKEKGIRLGGLVADNVAVESGHSIRGPKMTTDSIDPFGLHMYLHAMGMPRGWKIVENAANLASLAGYRQGSCTLIVGVPKAVGASGFPARLVAMCPLADS